MTTFDIDSTPMGLFLLKQIVGRSELSEELRALHMHAAITGLLRKFIKDDDQSQVTYGLLGSIGTKHESAIRTVHNPHSAIYSSGSNLSQAYLGYSQLQDATREFCQHLGVELIRTKYPYIQRYMDQLQTMGYNIEWVQ